MIEEIGSHSVPTSLHNLFIPNNLPRTDLKYDKVMPNVLFSWVNRKRLIMKEICLAWIRNHDEVIQSLFTYLPRDAS